MNVFPQEHARQPACSCGLGYCLFIFLRVEHYANVAVERQITLGGSRHLIQGYGIQPVQVAIDRVKRQAPVAGVFSFGRARMSSPPPALRVKPGELFGGIEVLLLATIDEPVQLSLDGREEFLNAIGIAAKVGIDLVFGIRMEDVDALTLTPYVPPSSSRISSRKRICRISHP